MCIMPELSKSALFFLPVMFLGTAAYASEILPDPSHPADAGTLQQNSTAPSGPDTNTGENRTDSEQPGLTVVEYQKSIRQLQQVHGAFYDQISEKLIGMGLAYRNLGQNKEAIKALNRALHINRINRGLYNVSQLPILDLIIQTNTDLQDWEALDQNYHYLYWVNRRIYGDNDPRLLPVINRLGRWHRNAYSLASDSVPFNHLLAADQLSQDAVRIIETNYGPEDPGLITPLYDLAMINYQIAAHASIAVMYDDLRYSRVNSGFMDDAMEEVRAGQDLMADSYRDGKKAMLKILDVYSENPDLPAADHGAALILLGDWYLLFDRRSAAKEAYAMAYSVLQESGIQKEDIDEIFAKPHSLPARQPVADYQPDQDNNISDDDKYVIARFDVSENGWARNIEIVESSPADNVPLIRRAKNSIRITRFRPRLENGQPVATAGVNIKYVDH